LDKFFPVICQQESFSRKEKESNIKSGQKKEKINIRENGQYEGKVARPTF